jgi:hypothetical protein
LDSALKELFAHVERYVMPLIGSDSPGGFSKEENRVLALQAINRFNQRIGQLARSGQSVDIDLRALQAYVNNLTIGIKFDNVSQMRPALSSIRGILKDTSPTS